jgi:hypothetical protein
VRLGLDDKTRTACSSRVAYRKQLLADLEAAGAQGKTKWLDRTKVAEVPRARAFLGAHEFTLKHMSAAQFKDGADAVKSAFMVWAQARLDEVSRYELPQPSSPDSAVEGLVPASLRIPEEAWQRVALAELYRQMDEIGLAHGEVRVTCARQLLKNLDKTADPARLRSTKGARAARTDEGVPHARRGSLAAEPAVLTLALIREQIEKVLPGAARLEGDAPAAAAASPRVLRLAVDEALASASPASPEDMVPLYPLPEGSPRGDNKTSAASQHKAAADQAQAPALAVNEGSASPPSSAGEARRTRVVLRAPKTLHHSFDKVEGSIDSAARAPKPKDKAALIEKARQELHSADQEFQRAAEKAADASPGKEPHWVGGARKRVAALDKRLAAVAVEQH